MKNTDVIASSAAERSNPMIWEGEEAAEGVFLGVAGDDPLALLGTPAFELPRVPRLPEDFQASERLRRWFATLRQGLAGAARGGATPAPEALGRLAQVDRQAVLEVLGEGEVTGTVSLDGVDFTVTEALLPGVWRLQGSDGSEYIEVGELPAAVTAAAGSLEIADYAIPAGRAGLMNAPAVLAEIRERAAAFRPGQDNHVINFTLMPMSDDDQAALRAVLGRAGLALESGGFGRCRVFATRYRHIWGVQYLNALDAIILDTLEIGAAPAAVRASVEDFEDSGARLDDILETYL